MLPQPQCCRYRFCRQYFSVPATDHSILPRRKVSADWPSQPWQTESSHFARWVQDALVNCRFSSVA
jgi:hypothetical protein